MNIKVKDRTYKATRDKNGWTLISPYMGVDKGKNPKLQHHENYFGKLDHLLKQIIDREAGHCETLEEVKEMIENFPPIEA